MEKYIVQELIYALEIMRETLLGGKWLEARGQVLRRDCLLGPHRKPEEGGKEGEGEGERGGGGWGRGRTRGTRRKRGRGRGKRRRENP